jgi:tripartite-type tricarboxylate transporter receptor subunit TctC
VPTTTEAGFPEIQAFIWFGLAAPAGTRPALVERISADVGDILKQPAFAERFVTALG